MISPFHIATKGYLCAPLAIATDGYIALCDGVVVVPEVIDVITKKQGGSITTKAVGRTAVTYIDPTKVQEELNKQILREEEEILIFIKAFVKCQ
tara:strand:+ start:697 stop:978 length:282 start_codon:yes stop_codon:yes gene_type:complete